ncbi:hypothetical protein ACIO3S_08200 [Nocardioides sp. NPDC087217]
MGETFASLVDGGHGVPEWFLRAIQCIVIAALAVTMHFVPDTFTQARST